MRAHTQSFRGAHAGSHTGGAYSRWTVCAPVLDHCQVSSKKTRTIRTSALVFMASRYQCAHTHKVSGAHTQGVTQGGLTHVGQCVHLCWTTVSFLVKKLGPSGRRRWFLWCQDINARAHTKFQRHTRRESHSGSLHMCEHTQKQCLGFETVVRSFYEDQHGRFGLSGS
jgi:hypothetical protein